MSSQKSPPAPLFAHVEVPTDSYSRKILDAAYAEFISLGLRRATVDRVAQRAKVGRMTVHRRFPAKVQLIEAVLARTNNEIIDGLADVAAAQDGPVNAVAESLATGIETLRDHPLFSRLVETDAEDIAPYLTFQGGPLLVRATLFVQEQLAGVVADPRERARIADAILRVCHSILLSPQGLHDLADPGALRTFLRPLVAALLPDE